jgi:hypothetical protein
MERLILFLLIIVSGASFQERQSINLFLNNPFDLQKFKTKKGGSNSGWVRGENYFFKPQEEGVYFRFFLFYPRGFVYDRNENRKLYVKPGDGLEIVTFKPPGKYRETFIDPTETLIQVTAAYNDPDLPELALVGLDSTSIKKRLGTPAIRKDSCLIYLYKEFGLSLHISNGAVDWIYYLRANTELKPSNLPANFTALKKRKLQFEKR